MMKRLALLAVLLPVNSTKDSFENTITVDDRTGHRAERLRVHDIAHAWVLLWKLVIEILQILRRPGIVADLEELDADLPWNCANLVESRGYVFAGLVDGIVGFAVGENDEVHGLGRRLLIALAAGDVRIEDGVHSCAKHGDASGLSDREDLSHRAA